jgi:Fis family transcriptional regulator
VAKTKKTTASKKGSIKGSKESLTNVRNRPLRNLTEEALKKYFKDLNGHKPGELYDLVLGEIEPPLLETVMDYTQGNQSRAAEILGINRATLRKKLKHYYLLD